MDYSVRRLKNKISQKNYFRKCYLMEKLSFEQLKQLVGEAHMVCWETLYSQANKNYSTQDYEWDQLEIFWLNFEIEMYIQMEKGNIFEFNREIVNRVTYSEHIFVSETTPQHFVLNTCTPDHNHTLFLCSQTADITAGDYCKAWLEEISIALGKLEQKKLAPVMDLFKKTGVLVLK